MTLEARYAQIRARRERDRQRKSRKALAKLYRESDRLCEKAHCLQEAIPGRTLCGYHDEEHEEDTRQPVKKHHTASEERRAILRQFHQDRVAS